MADGERVAAHYLIAELAARAAADQLRLRAAQGQAKSPANAAAQVVEAWSAALMKARASDAALSAQTSLESECLSKLKDGPLFSLYMQDGRVIRLHWDGPRGLTGSGLKFENNAAWMLEALLFGEECGSVLVPHD